MTYRHVANPDDKVPRSVDPLCSNLSWIPMRVRPTKSSRSGATFPFVRTPDRARLAKSSEPPAAARQPAFRPGIHTEAPGIRVPSSGREALPTCVGQCPATGCASTRSSMEFRAIRRPTCPRYPSMGGLESGHDVGSFARAAL